MIDFDKIELIALDLDETTLNEKGKLTQRTKKAIELAIEKSIHVVIASGRAYSALPREVLNIEGIEYAITSNGAAIYKIDDNECVYSCKIKAESVEPVINLRNKYSVTFEVFIDGIAYAGADYIKNPTKYGAPEKARGYLEATRNPIDDIEAFIMNNKDKLDSIDIVTPNADLRDEISALISEMDKDLFVTSSVPYLVELAYKEAGKGKALKKLADIIGVDLKNGCAFGNADNDIEMLEECGLAVAVENATPNCLDAADIIAPAHYEDGTAVIIERILNLK